MAPMLNPHFRPFFLAQSAPSGAFLETLETRFLATTWVLGAFQFASRACTVKYNGQNAGIGPWWAATAEVFKQTSAPLSAQTDLEKKGRLSQTRGADLNLSVGLY